MAEDEPLQLGDDCRKCGSDQTWYEVMAGDKPPYEAITQHCKVCGNVLKQQRPVKDNTYEVFKGGC